MPHKFIKANRPIHPAIANRQAIANTTQWVPVVSSTGQPLMPCHPARARELVKLGKAVKRRYQGVFYIQLTQRATGATQTTVVGVDPGSKMNGYSVKSIDHTFINIQQPARDGKAVKRAIETRRTMRRGRRSRHTPCRPRRFDNRSRAGWIPPSTLARWQHIFNTIKMLCKFYPIQQAVVEDVKIELKKGERRKASNFSPIMTGKNWLYGQMKQLGLKLHLATGRDTADLRRDIGVTKNPNKLHYSFFTHAVDAWVLANAITQGHLYPEMIQLTKLIRPTYCRRQLHMMTHAKGGVRRRYGGTILPDGLRKGTMVRYHHPKAAGASHLALVTGHKASVGYSLNSIDGKGRYAQNGQLKHMQPLYQARWLWSFPWSFQGYASRGAYLRDFKNGPEIVAHRYG